MDGTDSRREDAEVLWLFDPPDDAPPVAATPTEVGDLVDTALRLTGLDDVEVTATVSGLRRRARWASFELIDQEPGAAAPDARVRVVLFARALADVDAGLAGAGTALGDGMTVRVAGGLAWDAGWGSLRLVGRSVTALDTRGPLVVARDALLAELRDTGLADRQRGLGVPARPLRVALLAGAGTAGDADVRAVLARAGRPWSLTARSVPMAGPGAATAVAAGVGELAAGRPDVIVIARGGGARADLACFDTRAVAVAVASCPVPVWVAVGHATDTAVADTVAHRSWPTPTAAAEALVALVTTAERADETSQVRIAHADALARAAARTRAALLVAVVVAVTAVVVVMTVLGLR